MKKLDLTGTFTALITPFSENGEFDPVRFERQIDRQLGGGVSGLVPTGTTGEASTLSGFEHISVIAKCVKYVRGRVPVIAGAGSNSTKEAIDMCCAAECTGADGLLLVTPYYNRPSQRGLIAHFEAIARMTKLPIVLYNIPKRTGVDMLPETVKVLAESCQNIVGIKEASGEPDRVTELYDATIWRQDFGILCGDDSMLIESAKRGACGIVSVLSNYCPGYVVEMTSRALALSSSADPMLDQMKELIGLLFADGNPVGIKTLMKIAGHDSGRLRLPLIKGTPELEDALDKAGKGVKLSF